MSSNNSKYGQTSLQTTLNGNKSTIKFNDGFNLGKPISARVMSIILDENHPRFEELGGWNALGIIEYELVEKPFSGNARPIAKPLLGNNKSLPLINEIVYIIPLSDTRIGIITSNVTNYYVNIISLWNHPHHNGYPKNPDQLPESQQVDYIQTQLGNIRRVTDQSTEIYLGDTFIERSNIHPLKPFEGDIITEGRWGNSIRLGSTIKTKTNEPIGLNNWSTTGSSGDPIIILRNGQGNQVGEEGWIPVTENINDNDSSIYLTSTQRIPLTAANTSYNSYPIGSAPTAPNQYAGNQIVLNSGRLVFNATNDHILLTSNKSINLNTSNFNVDSPNGQVVLQTFVDVNQVGSIKLGDKDATEPLLYGNITQDLLQQLITSIKTFTNAVFTAKDVATINIAAKILNGQVTAIEKNTLPNIKSNISYTK
jgi:hypothetical protein